MGAVVERLGAAAALDPVPPDEQPGDVISPSQLITFIGCQQKWAFGKVWKVNEPATVPSVIGRAIHDATGAVHRCMAETGSILPAADAAQVYQQVWRSELPSVRLTAKHDPKELEQRGAALVELYVREGAPRVNPAAVEIDLPKDAEISGVRVRGRIDLVEADGRIRDTKSICRKPSGMLVKNRIQVTMYKMATPGASGEIGVDYLVKTKGKPQLVQIEDRVNHADELLVSQLLVDTQKQMRGGVYTVNRCSSNCNRLMCGYADLCESEFGGRVPMFPEAS